MRQHHKRYSNALIAPTITALCLVAVGLAAVGFGGCSAVKSPFPVKKKGEKRPASLSVPESVQQSLASGETMLVGDYVRFGNTQPIEIYGFGLVKGLASTGAAERDTIDRAMVLREMQRRSIPNPQSILQSNTTAVARLTATIPPGANIGDPVDISVILPPETDATSLRGGWLMETSLQDAAILEGNYHEGRGVTVAQGPIFVESLASGRNDPAELKYGTIIGGGVIRQPRILHINVRHEFQSVFIAERIAREINSRFYLPSQNNRGVATAKDDALVALEIAPMYTRNVDRYLRVIRAIALYDNPAKRLARLEQLKKDVASPQTAAQAVFQLEAIGSAAMPILRTALQSNDSRIRNHAALALAYLNDRTVTQPLIEMVKNEPTFRAAAFDALTVVNDDLDTEEALLTLLDDPSVEIRYGAFRALADRRTPLPMIQGELLGGQCRYHTIPETRTPLIHIAHTQRPEIVLFSNDIRLRTPFSLDAGPLVVTSKGNDAVLVSKFVSQGTDESRMVSTRLDEIIRSVVALGGTYPDIVQMLNEAQQQSVLTCRLEIDRHPQGSSLLPSFPTEELATETTPPVKTAFYERLNPKTWGGTETANGKKSRATAVEDNANRSARE